MAGYFCEIIAGDSEYPEKPHPAALQAVMEKHGIGTSEALVIGDSVIDVEAGRKAGVMTVAIAHGFSAPGELSQAGPDALVRDFSALLGLAVEQRW